jgi:very-short-patch-repair endonuclease
MSALGAPRANEIVSSAIALDTSNAPVSSIRARGRGEPPTWLSLTPIIVVNFRQLHLDNAEAAAIARGQAVARIARDQHGVVARRQLKALGLNGGAIGWHLRTGRLHVIHRGVYAVGRSTLDRHGQWMAAVLAYGDDAVLSHRSAGALWGILQPRGPVDVTSPSGRHGRSRIKLHRVALAGDEQTVRDRIPTTSVARTILDLAVVLDSVQLARAWEEADRLGLLQLGAVATACERAGRRKGIGAVRLLLSEARALQIRRSPLEDRFRAFCEDRGLPQHSANVFVLGREVDACWPSARLVVELDSFSFHHNRGAFEDDRTRDTVFLAAGYRTVRVTYRRLTREPDQLAAQLRKLLAERS